jgi:hypothetical protein
MLELYRGLVDIIVSNCRVLEADLIQHIRRDVTAKTIAPNTFGVCGFWNLMLEIIFVMFAKITFVLGITLTSVLAILFFPLNAFIRACATVFRTSSGEIYTLPVEKETKPKVK